jgi:thioredoxin-like negative regulator of GroEL
MAELIPLHDRLREGEQRVFPSTIWKRDPTPQEAQQDREERAALNAAEAARWQNLANEQRRQNEELRIRKLQEQADLPIPRLDDLLDLVRSDEGARIEFLSILDALDVDDPRVRQYRSALAARLH